MCPPKHRTASETSINEPGGGRGATITWLGKGQTSQNPGPGLCFVVARLPTAQPWPLPSPRRLLREAFTVQ